MKTSCQHVSIACLILTVGLGGCGEDDPEATSPPGGDAGDVEACNPDEALTVQDNASCEPGAEDYTPRDEGSANDTWAACISDDNTYHPFKDSISSIARVAAFEEIAELFGVRRFAGTDCAGLPGRACRVHARGRARVTIVRREDEHYEAAPESCRDLEEAEQLAHADRCVGPAKIRPVLNDAFQEGAEGGDPIRNAARVEAALLWFFYVSAFKEATTCADAPKDCDSSYAYYTGGEAREGGLGLSRYVRERSPQAHDRVWDGILATRCWRDLDNPTDVAENAGMQSLALAQLDKALLRGVALIVRQRLQNLDCEAAWETVKILGPVLDREAQLRDASTAASLLAEVSKSDASTVDVGVATDALDTLFPCP